MTEDRIPEETSAFPHQPNRWLATAAVALLCATVLSLVYGWWERQHAHRLATSQDQMNVALGQTRAQLEALSAKLNAMNNPPLDVQPVPRVEPPAVTARHSTLKRHNLVKQTATRPRAAEDPRWKKLQGQLDEQRNQITATQQNVDKARTDLEAKLNTAQDQLSGSIARTHDELVDLEKRGERSYYEFDLAKSKQFQKVGSISLSLRKTSTKKEQFDVVMLVDDFELSKKHVSLFEPVWIYPADSHQPFELVINRIDKDQVHGYVSEAKYKQTGSAASASTAGEATSASKGASTTSKGESTLAHRP